jgi:2-polyprenyl-6-methoxyphenol hydroxylase-like FAD-dependent oxidoreductase
MTTLTQNIIIIGAGMCGLASAISIAQAFSSYEAKPRITIYEVRDAPSTFGGPVNLTPKALRCLDKLGVFDELKVMKMGCEVNAIQLFSMRTGGQLAAIDYAGSDGKGLGGYKGWRVMRYPLLCAMLRIAERQLTVQIRYGKKLTRVEEMSDEVRVHFEDGGLDIGDLVLGCDGIHSAVRRLLVEPERKPVYSGLVTAYGFVEAKELFSEDEKPFFTDTALVMSRYGPALTTFCDHDRSTIYVVLLMEMEEQGSREGWQSIGKDQERVYNEGARRTQQSPIPMIGQMVEKVKDWTLYPVYILPPNGRWSTNRVLLLGDAAHAVSPSLSFSLTLGPCTNGRFSRCRPREKVSVTL